MVISFLNNELVKKYNKFEEPILNPRAGLVLAHDERYAHISNTHEV